MSSSESSFSEGPTRRKGKSKKQKTQKEKRTRKMSSSGEVQVSKSPAEFFAEHQAIAGFDNMGKSLYTSIRELMENSLDACESIGELPDISVHIEEWTQEQFNQERGFQLGQQKPKPQQPKKDTIKGTSTTTQKKASNKEGYFRIRVRDNGCGMKHEDIPNLLGIVLSGSKHGVRQTRGKFGLGAKMALIWSKKSTGVPIRVQTSHRPPSRGNSNSQEGIASHYSLCVLDMDIQSNRPNIIQHEQHRNVKRWTGTEMELIIAGNWTTYKARILQYVQQLAIITPYAKLELFYENRSDPKRNLSVQYQRRSEQMPIPAKQVKHHPSSVNNIVIQQLLSQTKPKTTLLQFLTTQLSSISVPTAKKLLEEWKMKETMIPTPEWKEIPRLVQLLRSNTTTFKQPDISCLSPLGEYNLSLGIQKVLEPKMMATTRDKASAYDGHPFLVEAAVCLGSNTIKEGINVIRFANRIPLLFEAGADVVTRVAMTKIKWSNYKLDPKKDRIGVFVSIVSTKIPYKGTGKEYIGDDCTAIQLSVKRALQACCLQLKTHVTKQQSIQDQKQKRSRLLKYVPDVSRALYGLLDGMRERHENNNIDDALEEPPHKKRKMDMIQQLHTQKVTRDTFEEALIQTIDTQVYKDEENPNDSNQNQKNRLPGQHKATKKDSEAALPLFLVPIRNRDGSNREANSIHVLDHPLFTFQSMIPFQSISPA